MSPPDKRSGPHSPVRAAQVAEVTTTTTTPTLPFPSDNPARDALRAKLAGIAQADRNTDAWWKSCCDTAIDALAGTGTVFQAYDLVSLGLPEPDHGNRWGPRFCAAVKRGAIEQVGYAASARPTTAGSIVRLWRGVRPR